MSQQSLLRQLVGKSVRLVLVSVGALLYFISSLLINLLQLVNFLLFQYTCPSLRRSINVYCQDLIFSQSTVTLEWYCGIRFRQFFSDKETEERFAKEHSLAIGNHRFQMDGPFYWLTGEITNSLGRAKAYAKADLRFMPIIGWVFYFGEYIFLRRNWQEDAKSIGPSLDILMSSPYPILLLILPEGTRYTAEKYAAAVAYAKEHNLPVNLKYHLLPRVKGFAKSLRHLQQKYAGNFGVYNMQLLSRSDEEGAYEPTVGNYISGKPFKVDCYIERIPDERLPKADASDEEEAKFLYEVFEKKDKLLEEHREYQRIPGSIMHVKERSLWRLVRYLILNVLISGSMVVYLLTLAFTTNSLALRATIFTLIILLYTGVFLIISRLKVSEYGAKKPRAIASDKASQEKAS